MKIIFVKEYTDNDTFDQWVTINVGQEAFLVDEVTGRIEFTEGFDRTITLEGIPSSCYAPLRTDM
jgi:hypothetical protein